MYFYPGEFPTCEDFSVVCTGEIFEEPNIEIVTAEYYTESEKNEVEFHM